MSFLSAIEGALGVQSDPGFSRLNDVVNPLYAEALRRFLVGAPADLVRDISVNFLASKWQVEPRVVIGVLLHAARLGLVDFSFESFCAGCNSVTHSPHPLAASRSRDACVSCRASFDNALDSTMVAIFSVNPSVRSVRRPAASKIDPSRSVPAIDVVNTPEFRQLFGGQVLAPGRKLAIGNLTIMFTDIYDSTATYSRRGDVEAFNLVRDHFDILFSTIKSYRGAVIKTIGDAVMAAFQRPVDAVACAITLRRKFDEFNSKESVNGDAHIKIGIHGGPCIAVTLNRILDYFGTTVNMAARVQSLAGKRDIVISSDLAAAPLVRELLAQERVHPQRRQASLKGIKGPQTVYQF